MVALPKTRPDLPDAFECAISLLRLLEIRTAKSPGLTRVLLAELTLRKLRVRDGYEPSARRGKLSNRPGGGWTLFAQ